MSRKQELKNIIGMCGNAPYWVSACFRVLHINTRLTSSLPLSWEETFLTGVNVKRKMLEQATINLRPIYTYMYGPDLYIPEAILSSTQLSLGCQWVSYSYDVCPNHAWCLSMMIHPTDFVCLYTSTLLCTVLNCCQMMLNADGSWISKWNRSKTYLFFRLHMWMGTVINVFTKISAMLECNIVRKKHNKQYWGNTPHTKNKSACQL